MATALVTGATSGIGAAYVRALAVRGYDLVLVARDRDRLDRDATRYRAGGRRVEVLCADLAVRADVDRVAARLADPADPVEVVVNNAGFSVDSSLVAPDLAVHDRAFDVMVRAVLALAGAAGSGMRQRGHGTVIMVGSVASLVPTGAYSAIKAWVTAYTEALAAELHGSGVRVLVVRPGWVRTEFHARAGISTRSIPRGLWIDADALVAASLRDLARGRVVSTPSFRFRVITLVLGVLPVRALVRLGRAVAARRGEAGRR